MGAACPWNTVTIAGAMGVAFTVQRPNSGLKPPDQRSGPAPAEVRDSGIIHPAAGPCPRPRPRRA